MRYSVGDRVRLKVPVTALGHLAHPGEEGTVQGSDPEEYLIVCMDDGRTTFPHVGEVDPA
ncbi:hypothetical protein [Streptomyces filamentosus]|uniref:hypothetical protein n=1 Tax=Streptomyces filamentosus TaxID=67294 RepID=UPI00332C6699